MALIRNQRDYALPLSTGRMVAPGITVNADVSGSEMQTLIAAGAFLIVDINVDPPAPTDPLGNVARRTYVATTQPAELKAGDIWFKTDATTGKVLDVLEMT